MTMICMFLRCSTNINCFKRPNEMGVSDARRAWPDLQLETRKPPLSASSTRTLTSRKAIQNVQHDSSVRLCEMLTRNRSRNYHH